MIRIIFPLIFSVAALISGNAAAQQTQPIEIADNAPDSYTVVRGDTLWDISGRFLKQPWRWPEVWKMNRDQIRNPHLIYPGQVVILDRSGPYLSVGRSLGGKSKSISGDQKLEPRVYSEPLSAAIPSIPLAAITPFLIQPLVIDDEELPDAGTVIATDHSRLYMGMGDTIYAKNISEGDEVWDVFRRSSPLVDPVTKEKLGYEATFLGTARVVTPGQPAELEILTAVEEIGVDDRLIPREKPELLAFVPHSPEYDVEGRVLALPGRSMGMSNIDETGRYSVVSLSVGSNDGIEVGHVLALHRNRGKVEYKNGFRTEVYDLPEKLYGLVFVFRVFERVSYALVMESLGPVAVGDTVRKP